MLYLIIQALINGVMNGAIYALIAVGITVIFGVMRLINFASGAYLMLSMYIGYIMYRLTGWNCYALIPAVAIISALVAYVSFKLAVYPALKRNKDATIIATVGLGFLLQNLIVILFGSSPPEYSFGAFYKGVSDWRILHPAPALYSVCGSAGPCGDPAFHADTDEFRTRHARNIGKS